MNLFKMEFKRGLKPLAIWGSACTLLIILFMSMFPSMKDSGMQALVNAKMSAMPPALLKAFNLENVPDFSKLDEYLAYALQYIVIAGCIYAGILGAKSLIAEESEGTIEFLYAQPISRKKILAMKCLSVLSLFLVFVMLMGITSFLIAFIVKPHDLNTITLLMEIKQIFAAFFLVGVVFMSIGLLISVLVPHLRFAMPLSASIFFITYLFGIFAGMIDKLGFLKYLSPFGYAVPAEMIKNGINSSYIAISLSSIMVSFFLTYLIYQKKDFRI